MRKINYLIKDLKEGFKVRSEHFRAYAESKTRTNLYYMLFSALAGTALTTVLILLSPVIIKGWRPQPVYFVFYPIFAVFILFAAFALGKKKISAAFVRSTSRVFSYAVNGCV